ncbi:GTP-binding protein BRASSINAZOLE INSENSITIVE PALE GREEN 2, chloroplastic [Herrania umbratica]|uniref:GTP-binding protein BRASSINAZOLE INSENSITIVE PALE GREEN 2, chloroplastic n=1 Tax=Herrania umbratica TaxID=108875 RepID=A0A6J1A2C3_9ROSI|nr:GTP-binding protein BRASSINAZOLE INSENSITIVE PALE GREEN 2, chloroplastic [Herrania umbratica]XP_021281302.1 GTP-binding protein BRASSINAZOLE INSENSITIVE PALE GREEN 2, chloroplastic [Herrania umbratica]
MIIRARNLSPSKLKPLSSLSLFFTESFTSTTGAKTSIPLLPMIKPQISNLTPHLLFVTNHFSFQSTATPSPPKKHQKHQQKQESSSSKSLTLNRDGNYDDATPHNVVCPGCGVHMQDSDPKHPGFFINPRTKTKDLMLKIGSRYLVPVSTEPEFTVFLKKGVLSEEKGESPGIEEENLDKEMPEKPVVCARCHSLRHYGKVKDPTVENLLPEFDFDHTVGRRLGSVSGARSVVLMVVDASDFDGSFPRKVAKLVSDVTEENYTAWKQGKSGNVPRIVLVVTKIDLLPSSLSPTRFEHWVRQRAREGGASKIAKLHFVSPVRDWGVKSLVEDVVEMAGPRGTVWAVGAQNAGKSTLINAIGKCVGGKIGFLTEAPVPGTTLGIVRVEGVLPGQAKLFDTPGLLQPHQMTTRLTREEQKLVYVSKELKPRTYRIKAGHTVHIAGLMRLDIEESSVESLYVTVWASPYLPLHVGRTENAHRMLEDHFGRQLQPPIGEERVEELGSWVRKQFHVYGHSWDSSSVDLAAAGIGWFAIGLNGEAVLGVWTYDGVDVVLRNALIPHRAQLFEEAGFTVSKIVSKADQALNKSQKQNEKKKKQSHQKTAITAEF